MQALNLWIDAVLDVPTRKAAASLGIFLGCCAIVVAGLDEALTAFFGTPRVVSWDEAQDALTVCLSFTLVAISGPGLAAFLSGFLPFAIAFVVFVLPNIWPASWAVEVGGVQTVLVAGALVFQIMISTRDASGSTPTGGTPSSSNLQQVRRYLLKGTTWWLPGLASTCFFVSLWLTFIGIRVYLAFE